MLLIAFLVGVLLGAGLSSQHFFGVSMMGIFFVAFFWVSMMGSNAKNWLQEPNDDLHEMYIFDSGKCVHGRSDGVLTRGRLVQGLVRTFAG